MDSTTLTPRSTGSYASVLVRYVLAGTLARSADAGAIVGVVLLAADPPTGSPLGTSVGGLLAAALTAPHLLGPVAGRRLDAARDARRLLAVACLAYAGCLLLGAMAVGRAPLVVPVILLALAGLTGPLLTGGLSSQLARMLPADDGVQRRAQGWDAVSYGIAGTAGPAAVAAVATVVSPLAAIAALAATAVVGGLLTLVLPRPVSSTADGEAVGIGQALRLLGSRGPLRRVTGATCAASLAMATLPVVAVVLAPQVGGGTAAGATLAAAFGVGNLAGSALMTAVPLRAEPERATLRYLALIGLAIGLCAVSPTFGVAVGAYALAGLANAPFFVATLGVRARYSPEAARAQVFVSISGLKVAAGSAGAAVAGLTLALGGRTVLAAGGALCLLAALGAALGRRRDPAAPA